MIWRDIEEEFSDRFGKYTCSERLSKCECAEQEHDAKRALFEAPDFFKSQFKQAMEEMVGDKVECTKEEWAHHKNRWQQEEHNKFRQEILDKLNKFFE